MKYIIALIIISASWSAVCSEEAVDDEVEEEVLVSSALFEDMTGVIDGIEISGTPYAITGGHIYQEIEGSKTFSEYEFDVSFSYRYAVTMDIYVSSGMCVTARFWSSTLFSNPNEDCDDNLIDAPQYTIDEFILLYGDLAVDEGRNFNSYVPRSYPLTGEWYIE